MYEDSWYNFVPDVQNKKASSSQVQGTHRRKESLLQQPNVSCFAPHHPRPYSKPYFISVLLTLSGSGPR